MLEGKADHLGRRPAIPERISLRSLLSPQAAARETEVAEARACSPHGRMPPRWSVSNWVASPKCQARWSWRIARRRRLPCRHRKKRYMPVKTTWVRCGHCEVHMGQWWAREVHLARGLQSCWHWVAPHATSPRQPSHNAWKQCSNRHGRRQCGRSLCRHGPGSWAHNHLRMHLHTLQGQDQPSHERASPGQQEAPSPHARSRGCGGAGTTTGKGTPQSWVFLLDRFLGPDRVWTVLRLLPLWKATGVQSLEYTRSRGLPAAAWACSSQWSCSRALQASTTKCMSPAVVVGEPTLAARWR